MSMMKTIRTKNPIQDPLDAPAPKPPRDERRQAAHRGLAECEAAGQEYLALKAELARLQADMDNAANEHVRTCEPIQAELKRINDNSVTRVLAGQPAVDAREDKRRAELLAELSDANAKLEDTLRRLKAASQPIQIRATEAGQRAARRPTFHDELIATADPQLRIVSAVAERTWRLALQRYDQAAEQSKLQPSEFWTLELATAAQLRDAARTESDAAYQALLTSE